jgi:hypothetical protein
MHLKIPHQLSQAEALAKVKKALAEAKLQLVGKVAVEEERWEGPTLHFAFVAERQRIAGTLGVGEAEFELNAKLPLMLKLFEGKIERAIREQVALAMKNKK